MSPEDKYIYEAIKLALKGHPSPNPKVGAVIVKNNKIISIGFHDKWGFPHAEQMALQKAENNARGADLYITLEPCDHYGKTPPCTEAIIKAGIKRVFVGMIDPDPRVSGKGIEKLKSYGIKVFTNIGENKINEFYYDYITHRKEKRPGITLKIAASLDGKIATYSGDSKWISCEESRRFVHKCRHYTDAVMIGKGTLIKDNPQLTPYLLKNAHYPGRVIVSTKLDLDPDLKIFSQDKNITIIAYCDDKIKNHKLLNRQNIELLKCNKNSKGKVDLKDLIYKLAEKGIVSLFVEGGNKLSTELLELKLVDKLYLIVAPILIGGKDSFQWFSGQGIKHITDSIKINNMKFKKLGKDIFISGYPSLL